MPSAKEMAIVSESADPDQLRDCRIGPPRIAGGGPHSEYFQAWARSARLTFRNRWRPRILLCKARREAHASPRGEIPMNLPTTTILRHEPARLTLRTVRVPWLSSFSAFRRFSFYPIPSCSRSPSPALAFLGRATAQRRSEDEIASPRGTRNTSRSRKSARQDAGHSRRDAGAPHFYDKLSEVPSCVPTLTVIL